MGNKCFRGDTNDNDDRRPTIISLSPAPDDKHERKSSQLSKYSDAENQRHVIPEPLRVGAFNARRFGKAKMAQGGEVVAALVEIVKRYDVLLLQVSGLLCASEEYCCQVINVQLPYVVEVVIQLSYIQSYIFVQRKVA